jgi:hypothetical protein
VPQKWPGRHGGPAIPQMVRRRLSGRTLAIPRRSACGGPVSLPACHQIERPRDRRLACGRSGSRQVDTVVTGERQSLSKMMPTAARAPPDMTPNHCSGGAAAIAVNAQAITPNGVRIAPMALRGCAVSCNHSALRRRLRMHRAGGVSGHGSCRQPHTRSHRRSAAPSRLFGGSAAHVIGCLRTLLIHLPRASLAC